jgi:ubiquinone/menaquinone biosynthesis C-methylase UbiE
VVCKLRLDVVYSDPRRGGSVATRRVDYDQLAAVYDQRFSGAGVSGRTAVLRSLVAERGGDRVLEVGTGTGHWLRGLEPCGCTLYGLDLSAGMLRQAQAKGPGPELVRGDAHRLPFASQSVDLAFCVNALHHFVEPRAFVGQAFRVLEPGGSVAILGSDPRDPADRWYVYEFFEGTLEADLQRFPAWEAVEGWMVAAGLSHVESQVVEHISDPKPGRTVWGDPFLRKDACSQLALLSDRAYAPGLQRMEAALSQGEARGQSVVFATELTIRMAHGQQPERKRDDPRGRGRRPREETRGD